MIGPINTVSAASINSLICDTLLPCIFILHATKSEIKSSTQKRHLFLISNEKPSWKYDVCLLPQPASLTDEEIQALNHLYQFWGLLGSQGLPTRISLAKAMSIMVLNESLTSVRISWMASLMDFRKNLSSVWRHLWVKECVGLSSK